MALLQSMREYFRLKKDKNKEIVFYSEGKSYWINFRDVMECLTERYKQKVYYVTSDPADPVLQRKSEFLKPYCISNEFFRILFFQTLEAGVFITTLPDINSFHLKRSPGVEKMVYIHHTLGSSNMVFLPGAFDAYDVIMCAGPHQMREAREMEAYYHTPEKQLIEAGYPPLDDLLRRLPGKEKLNRPIPVATIAPSWQSDNILDRVAVPLINSLLDEGLTVKLRPHPRTLKFEMDKIRKIVQMHENNNRFFLDNSPGSFDSYLNTDIMITDWSGTAFKYCFAMLRPALFINTPPKARNPDYRVFTNCPVELIWRDKLGRSLDEENINEAGGIVARMLQDSSWRPRLEKFREEHVFNPGKGGERTASAIMDLLRGAPVA